MCAYSGIWEDSRWELFRRRSHANHTSRQKKKKKKKKEEWQKKPKQNAKWSHLPCFGTTNLHETRDEIREGIIQNQQNTNKMATKQKCDLKQIMEATSRHKLELHINIYTDFGLEAFISHTLMLSRNEKSSHELYE